MLRSSRSGAVTSFFGTKVYSTAPVHTYPVNGPAASQYDSASFSAISDEARRFQMDTVSRLTQEVRTATTTGKVQELRQSVSAGEYVPDATEIAKRLLFFPEG